MIPRNQVKMLLDELLNISKGVCTVSEEELENETDETLQEVKAALLFLHDELEYERGLTKQYLQEVTQEKEKLHEILEFAPLSIFSLTKDCMIKYTNKRARHFFGVQQDLENNINIQSVIPELTNDVFYILKKSSKYSQLISKRLNVYKTLELTLVTTYDGYLLTIEDLTDQIEKGAQITALNRSLQSQIMQLEATYAILPTSFLWVNRFGQITDARVKDHNNKPVPIHEVLSSYRPILLPDEIYDKIRFIIPSILNSENAETLNYSSVYEHRTYYKEASFYKFDEHTVFIIINDITQQYETEELKKEYLNKREEHFQLLEQNNDELKTFVYSVSHDIMSPLKVITAYSEIILDDFKADLTDDVYEYIQRILKSGKKINSLLQDLLKYSRVNKESMQQEQFSLTEMILDLTEEMRITYKDKNIHVEHENTGVITAHKPYIENLFRNLLSNSIKYNENERIEIKIVQQNHSAFTKIYFSDNGIGIETRDYERIFNVFQRLHNAQEYSGNGIGLTICKKIMDLHGGTLSVLSEMGKGSTFTIHLPQTEENE